jgi:hypothetical protein
MIAVGQHSSLLGQVDCVDVKPHLHPEFPLKYGFYEMGHDPAAQKDASNVPSYQPWLSPRTRLRLGDKWRASYEADLAAGALERFMWSTFADPVTPETDISKFRVWQRDKSETPGGKVHHQLCNLKNSSFPIEDLLAENGFDEDLDGCHGHQDSEIAGRLEKNRGVSYWLVHKALVTLFEAHGIGILRGYWKPEDHNLKAYSRKWDTGQWYGGSELDLRKLREETLND